jgi:phosphoribulokinase
MSRINTFVVPGGKMGLALELIMTPLIENLIEKRRKLIGQLDWIDNKK